MPTCLLCLRQSKCSICFVHLWLTVWTMTVYCSRKLGQPHHMINYIIPGHENLVTMLSFSKFLFFMLVIVFWWVYYRFKKKKKNQNPTPLPLLLFTSMNFDHTSYNPQISQMAMGQQKVSQNPTWPTWIPLSFKMRKHKVPDLWASLARLWVPRSFRNY